MKKLSIVFLIYLGMSIGYHFIIQVIDIDYEILNRISQISILCLHLGAIFGSILVTNEMDKHQQFLMRLSVSVLYLLLLYLVLDMQIFMLK